MLEGDLTGRFELGQPLGSGAFGAVFRAREVAAGRDVALKVLTAAHGATLERFVREAKLTARLQHPGIVRVHAAGTFRGAPCIVYELVEGESLDAAARALDQRRRVALVRDAARAVGHAHAQGVVHRDLKAENLLVGRDGRLRVADFGVARVEGLERLTRTGALVGTATHFAPEQFEGVRELVGPHSDVWALGVVLYQALTGRLPFDEPSLIGLMTAVRERPPPPPRTLDPRIEPALERVVLRALERDPARRYPDGEALARALDAALAGELEGAVAGPRRGRLVAAAALAAGAALALAGALALRGAAPPTDPASPAAPPTSSTKGRDAAGPASGRPAPPAAAVTTPRSLRGLGRVVARWLAPQELVLAGEQGVERWDVATGERRRWWDGVVERAAPLPDGGLLLWPRGDAWLRRLRPGQDAPRAWFGALTGQGLAVVAVRSPRAAFSYTRAGCPAVLIVDLGGAQPVEHVELTLGSDLDVCDLALSADGLQLAMTLRRVQPGSAAPGAVCLFDLSSAARRRWLLESDQPCRGVTFSPDGALVFVAYGRSLAAYRAADGQNASKFGPAVYGGFVATDDPSFARLAHDGAVGLLAASRDGARLASTGEREVGFDVKTWDVATGREVAQEVVAGGRPTSLDVSPDGRLLAVASDAGLVEVHALR